MKKISYILILAFLFAIISGCSVTESSPQVVATTLPVYEFTARLCQNTSISVGRLVTENVSCLHDYSLQVSQMRMIERAEYVVISGAGLESFLEGALQGKDYIDASDGVHIHEFGGEKDHDHSGSHSHSHDLDPHIWLSVDNAKSMASNIYSGLCDAYPEFSDVFLVNLADLHCDLDVLQAYGEQSLENLSCCDMITFHDGFGYLAEAFDLSILEAVEEESGSEASAAEIIHLAELIHKHNLPAIFIERSGSDACAGILSRETGVKVYTLDMAMAGDSYFDAMYHNINTIKEALE